MKNLKFLPIFLALALLLGCLAVPAAAVEKPTVSAPTALVVDAHGGNPVFAKNADARIYPASTTKIMTVLLAVEAIERGEIDPEARFAAPAAALQGLPAEGSSAGILAGEELSLRQLLYCAMLVSANEAANLIAFRLAGGVAPFTELMNARAAALGCTDTHFANAHGLPDDNHYSTACDMARIAVEALHHPMFAEICATAQYEVPATNLTGARVLNNTNALLTEEGFYGAGFLYEDAVGVKTGHTTAAGYCLVSAASRGGIDVVSLVFGEGDAAAAFRDSKTLCGWALDNHVYREVNTVSDCVGTVPVRSDDGVEYVELCPAEDLTLLLPADSDLSAFERDVTVSGLGEDKMLAGPVKPGTVLGTMRLLLGGESYGSVDLVPASSAILIQDRRSGEIIYAKGIDNRVYPADTTMLMTALLAAEAVEGGKVSLNDMVTVTEAINIDLPEGAIRCGLQVGEQITLGALLQCMLIGSASDAANMIADYVGGSVPDFVAQMNERAAKLGCDDTSFSNAHGAYSPDHYTTARDFSRIAGECIRHERIKRICGTVVAELKDTNLTPARTLRNTNALICDESIYGADYVYEDADGLKTGFNERAGYALAATAGRDGIDLLMLIFGGVKDDSGYSNFSGAITLFDWIFDNFAYQEVLKSTENIASVDVALGKNATYVNLRPDTSITVLLPKDTSADDFEKHIRVYALENGEPVKAPVTAGQVLGEVTLTRDGRGYGTVKLVASASVQLGRMEYIKQQIRETTQQRRFRIVVSVLAALFILYLIWVLIYRIKHLRHVYAVRAAERDKAMTEQAAMKPAPEPKAPEIRFFDERGRTAAPERPDDGVRVRTGLDYPDGKIVPFGAGAAPAPAEKDDDLLASAVLVAKKETPPLREETAAEKAERDYFAEFFRQKD